MRNTVARSTALVCLGWALARVAYAADAPDVLVDAFDGTDYGSWRVEGAAFGAGPPRGTLPGQMPVSGFEGAGLVNSYLGGDGPTGRLVSADFTIERRRLVFLIGGGGWPGRTCLNLVVGTGVVRTATGPNTEPGGSEALAPSSWDVSEFAGRVAHLEIVDAATGGWGHINVDRIVQSDRPAPPTPGAAEIVRELLLDRPYLLLPVSSGRKPAKPQVCSIEVDGAVVRRFDIDLADAPDWFAHVEVDAWRGKKAVLRIRGLPADAKAPDLIATADAPWNEAAIYREPLRGQFHFSPRRGWNNDPNGLVWAGGVYHLYYQHNPCGWSWGNMHWGHAVSPDLVHWRELPIAIHPRQYGDWAFSGSAVVDRLNTAGWRRGTNDAIVAAFTSTARGECIAYSTDGGRTFTEYEGNPVLRHAGRDPRLLWHAPSQQWVMAVYDEFQGGRYIAFHTSPDLKTWTFQSRIAGFYECPDLFALPTPGAGGGSSTWVLTDASSDYMLGRFDGQAFTAETPKLKGHRGRGYYAAQTFSGEPRGRVVQMGWFQTETRGMPFNQSMSVPLELGLRATEEGPRLAWTPVTELEALRVRNRRPDAFTLKPGDANPLADFRAELVELRAEVSSADAAALALTIRGARIGYDFARQELTVNGLRAQAPLRGGRQRLTVFCDRTGLEVFASDGLCFVPMPFQPRADDDALGLAVEGGAARVEGLQVHELRPAW